MRPEPFDPTPSWNSKLRHWYQRVDAEEARLLRASQTFEAQLTFYDKALLSLHHQMVQGVRRSQ